MFYYSAYNSNSNHASTNNNRFYLSTRTTARWKRHPQLLPSNRKTAASAYSTARRTKNKKVIKLYCHTEALTKTTDCTCKAKKVKGTTNNNFLALRGSTSFQRRWIWLHRPHRTHHHRLVHKTVGPMAIDSDI